MKVIVLEFPDGEQAQVALLDLSKVDPTNQTQVEYKDAIELAIQDADGTGEIKIDYSFFSMGMRAHTMI